MSKQRPSSQTAVIEEEFSAGGGLGTAASQWLPRLFRNSYTRDGQCFVLDGWAVKIQHEGQRRTFSLWGKTKQEAALEAKAIHDTILTEGWEAALRNHPSRSRVEERFPKTDVRYWRQRLIVRRYRFPASGGTERDLAARIDHMGLGYFCPLGTEDPETAAARARIIYQTVVEEGWGSVCRRFSRELIIGMEWSADPILWTYITVHTLVAQTGEDSIASNSAGRRLLIVEADPGIRRALMWCIRQQTGFCVMGCETDAAFQRALAEFKPQLVLLNRNLAGRFGLEFPGQLTELREKVPALTYSTYADGDQMFVSTPGGSEGYMLRRLKPDRLLEPILEASSYSASELLSRIKSYFKGLLQSRTDSETSGLARLTPREREVLTLLSKGCVDKEIAQALGISAWTVHGHIKKIFERLHVRTRTEAVVRYLEK